MCGVPQRNCKCKRKRRGMKTTQTQMQMQVQASTQVMTNFNFFLSLRFRLLSLRTIVNRGSANANANVRRKKLSSIVSMPPRHEKKTLQSVRKFPLLFDKRFLEFRLYQTRVRHFRHLISCANCVWYLQASFSVI